MDDFHVLHQFSLFCVSLVALRARVPIVLFLSLDALVHVFLVGFQSLEIGKVSPTNLTGDDDTAVVNLHV